MHRLHRDEAGFVRIPAMSIKNGLSDTAKFLGQKITGKGNATWTKHFLSGVLVLTDIVLAIKADEVRGEWLFVASNGVSGNGKRVWKKFPIIDEWAGVAEIHILDDQITQEVFTEHMKEFGRFIGIGRFRPQRGGFYGRFRVESIDWQDEAA